ncbi:MAG: SGNH/GDSL hydrolase family protein [Sedimentisphaerales bacterium]
MQRREFLGKLAGTSLAVLTLNEVLKGDPSDYEKHVRAYLHSITPSRQRVEDFLTGEYGPRDQRPGEVFRYDPELGWVNHKAIGSTGVDGTKVFYNYEPDGARKVINFPGQPSRIRTYGNSFTHCSQANNNETWEEYLAAHLQEPVRNYGVGGYSVYQAYRRMLKVEKQFSGGYIILNIWDDDHYRNLDAWRSIRYGYGSRCGFTLPHLRVDVAKGRCQQMENVSNTPEALYKLCDEEYLWRTFKDDPILKMVMAAREGGRNISDKLINPVAVTFGIPDEKIADTEAAKKIKKIHTEAALFATQNVVTLTEEFAKDAGKKLMVMLSFGRGNVAAYLAGKPSFDRSFVDWLKDKPYPVIDMREAFAADYKRYKVDINEYLKPFYNGHHTPKGNFFTAWALKDRIVQWLNPKPKPYR